MNILLAISSWPISAQNGDHQALRDTWINQSDVDCRFFMGDGTPINENEDSINVSWNDRPQHYKNKLSTSIKTEYIPMDDEVLLSVPYDFKHLPFKVREIFRWAYEREYDYIFKCDTDTYVDIPRLLNSGFENFDYIGTPFYINEEQYASGGAGYWISKRGYSLLLNSPIQIPWDDIWAGQELRKHGITMQVDTRYNVCMPHNFLAGPRPDNNSITSHLGFSPEPFNKDDMFLAHSLRFPN
jgi:hypothetical protein